nr:MAG TPA: hypothetical protein [Caudoviricetes sp.]
MMNVNSWNMSKTIFHKVLFIVNICAIYPISWTEKIFQIPNLIIIFSKFSPLSK